MRTLILASSAAVALLAGCGAVVSDDPARLSTERNMLVGDKCLYDEDCYSNEVCEFGMDGYAICVEGCRSDKQCVKGGMCVAQPCAKLPCPAQCVGSTGPGLP